MVFSSLVRNIETTVAEVLSAQTTPSVDLGAMVSDAVATMRSEGAACVLVMDEGTLRGIFTERDFLIRVATPALVAASTRVRDVMTASPDTLEAEDSVAHAIHLMAEHGFRNVPIVDSSGKPAALLSVPEVVAHLAKVGGKPVIGGQVTGLRLGQVEELWDTVAIAMYPNRKARQGPGLPAFIYLT